MIECLTKKEISCIFNIKKSVVFEQNGGTLAKLCTGCDCICAKCVL
jgi:hypothetical protein